MRKKGNAIPTEAPMTSAKLRFPGLFVPPHTIPALSARVFNADVATVGAKSKALVKR